MDMHKNIYQLFYSPGACSMAVHAVLNAIGADFELVDASVNSPESATEIYKKINPLGQVPVLIKNGHVFKESAAILIYLLESAGHPLLPQNGEAKAQAIQWLLFFNSTMHQTYGGYFLISKNLKDKAVAEASLHLMSRRIQKLWRYVESQIETPFLCGDHPTAGDILMAVIANWSFLIEPGFALPEKVKGICERVVGLTYFQKTLETEGIVYKIP